MKQYPLQKAKSENMFSDTIIFICTLAYRVISHGRLWKVSRTNVNEKGFTWSENQNVFLLLLLLSHFGCVWPCVTPQMAAHQAPLSLGFSRQKHWSGLPVPSPMHASEKWKWSHSVVSNPQRPHGLQPTRLLRPWDSPGKSTGVGCHCLLSCIFYLNFIYFAPIEIAIILNSFNFVTRLPNEFSPTYFII